MKNLLAPPVQRIFQILGINTNYNQNILIQTFWVVLSYLGNNVLRLVSNLILTRLLAPEFFGLMVIVNLIILGLGTFSDFGLGQSIICSKRGDDPVFLRTTWTIQVLRGAVLWIFSWLLAYPAAIFYDQDILLFLIPVVGLSALFSGFNSIIIFKLNKKLFLKKITIWELTSQIISIACMVTLAVIFKNVWALAIGGVIASGIRMILSHFMLEKFRHTFIFDRSCFSEIYSFGKWIFLSTMLTFLANQGDRILFGKLMTLSQLGVYSIALLLAQSAINGIQAIAGKIIFPVYSNIVNQDNADKSSIIKFRKKFLLATILPVSILVIFGDHIVEFMYDDRYLEAGWILQVLSLQAIAVSLELTISPIVLASGNTKRQFWIVALKLFLFAIAILLGNYINGYVGIIWAISLYGFVYYPMLIFILRHYGIHSFKSDLLYLGLCIITIGTGIMIF